MPQGSFMIKVILHNRYLLARRTMQLGVLALFIAGFRLDWTLLGRELIEGNLSASRLFGVVPLADPLAVLQIGASGHLPGSDLIWGALIVVGFYFLVGGRVFCSWVCPVNMVADAADATRRKLGLPSGWALDRRLKYAGLLMALLLSAITGVAAFEWVSPIGLMHRGVIYGMGVGWIAIAAVFFFDLLVLRQGWCGHLCPLGAFYSLLGRYSPLKVKFDKATCTACGDCHRVCPEPQVLNLKKLANTGRVLSGSCTNCGRCITRCPEGSLAFIPRANSIPGDTTILFEGDGHTGKRVNRKAS